MSLFLMQQRARARPRPNRNRIVDWECLNLRHGVRGHVYLSFGLSNPWATHPQPPKGIELTQKVQDRDSSRRISCKDQSKLIDWWDVAEPRGLIAHAHVIGVSIRDIHSTELQLTQFKSITVHLHVCMRYTSSWPLLWSTTAGFEGFHMSFATVIKSLQIKYS